MQDRIRINSKIGSKSRIKSKSKSKTKSKSTIGCSRERTSLHQPIPVVPLTRFVAEVFDESLHISHAHTERRAGLRHHVLLNHDAAKVVRSVLKRDLADVQSLGDP